jgi:hypothetical protein
MIKQLLTVVALGSMAVPAAASPLQGLAAGASTNATNTQSNQGSIIQAPSGGTQTNVNQNNSFNSTYSFGPGISCPTPAIAASIYNGYGDSNSSGFTASNNALGGSIALIYPLGGDVGTACKSLVNEIAKQRVLDTQVTMINVCAQFAQQGVVIDTKQFPEFKVCAGVTVNGASPVNITDNAIKPEQVLPVIPIN